MSISTTDLTMRTDNTGNMVTGKNGEYVINKIKMLFNMQPGTDDYETDRGVNIQSYRYKTYVNNSRDTELESKIVKQITTYTDFTPINVVSLYINGSLTVSLTLKVSNELYAIQVNATQDTLSALLIK